MIGIARGRLAKAAPYLAPLFYRLAPVPCRGLERPETDGEKLFFDPDWLKADFEAGGAGVCAAMAHAAAHCLLGHPWAPPDDQAADLAAAMLVEARLPDFCPARGSGAYREAKRRLSGARLSDVAAAMAGDAFFREHRAALSEALRVDGHGRWRADAPGCLSGGGPGESWRESARDLGLLRTGAGGRRGREAGAAVYRLHVIRAPERAYGEALRRYAGTREYVREDPDAFQPGLYAYGLARYGNLPLIEPAETREERRLDELAVVIDTSGSCVRALTVRFLEETLALLRDETLFTPRFNLHLIQCDARVQRDDRITCLRDFERTIEELEIVGGGGTDYTPAFAHIDRLVARGSFRRLNCALFFTDGQGIYPSHKPDYDVIFACYRGHSDLIDAPGWVRRLMLELPEGDGRHDT